MKAASRNQDAALVLNLFVINQFPFQPVADVQAFGQQRQSHLAFGTGGIVFYDGVVTGDVNHGAGINHMMLLLKNPSPVAEGGTKS